MESQRDLSASVNGTGNVLFGMWDRLTQILGINVSSTAVKTSSHIEGLVAQYDRQQVDRRAFFASSQNVDGCDDSQTAELQKDREKNPDEPPQRQECGESEFRQRSAKRGEKIRGPSKRRKVKPDLRMIASDCQSFHAYLRIESCYCERVWEFFQRRLTYCFDLKFSDDSAFLKRLKWIVSDMDEMNCFRCRTDKAERTNLAVGGIWLTKSWLLLARRCLMFITFLHFANGVNGSNDSPVVRYATPGQSITLAGTGIVPGREQLWTWDVVPRDGSDSVIICESESAVPASAEYCPGFRCSVNGSLQIDDVEGCHPGTYGFTRFCGKDDPKNCSTTRFNYRLFIKNDRNTDLKRNQTEEVQTTHHPVDEELTTAEPKVQNSTSEPADDKQGNRLSVILSSVFGTVAGILVVSAVLVGVWKCKRKLEQKYNTAANPQERRNLNLPPDEESGL